MFIERLTDEQIKEFANRVHEGFSFEFTREKNCISYYITNNRSVWDYSWYEHYTDFGERCDGSSERWLKYLYEIFGEEYKAAYLAECAKVFEK